MGFIREELPNPVVVHLYVNDYSPDLTTTLGDFTEATFPGYLPVSTAFLTDPFLNGDDQAEIDSSIPAPFTSTGTSTQTAYGYWVDSGPSTDLLWAERFTSPVPFLTSGQFVQVQLVLTGVSAFSG